MARIVTFSGDTEKNRMGKNLCPLRDHTSMGMGRTQRGEAMHLHVYGSESACPFKSVHYVPDLTLV